MDLPRLRQAVTAGRIRWRVHALEAMLERAIGSSQVIAVLVSGQVLEDYPDDTPYPSALFMAPVGGRVLHVVVAFDAHQDYAYVVTAYEPDTDHFEPDFRTRRRHG